MRIMTSREKDWNIFHTEGSTGDALQGMRVAGRRDAGGNASCAKA